MRYLMISAAVLTLAACGLNGTDNEQDQSAEADRMANAQADNLADTMASDDDGLGAQDPALQIPDSEPRPIMQAQVVLDRIGFGPGVIDGKMGMSTENALRGFQIANDLDETGKLDDETKAALKTWDRIPATRVVRIPQDWSELKFEKIPDEPEAKAKLDSLAYETLDERLAERFHTTVEVLKALNPGGKPATSSAAAASPATASASPSPAATSATGDVASLFAPGQLIRVPNIGGDRIAPAAVDDARWQKTLQMLGVGSDQPEVDRVVVSKAGKTLKAYQGDKLIALFTVSSGSSEFPLPLGNWKIKGEAYNPPYSYDPEVLGKDNTDGKSHQFPAGPNSPVGVVWIDLSKEHYGIHGTPDPETIGRAQSSGCVRLTNWDAARLAQMVSQKTKVEFVA